MPISVGLDHDHQLAVRGDGPQRAKVRAQRAEIDLGDGRALRFNAHRKLNFHLSARGRKPSGSCCGWASRRHSPQLCENAIIAAMNTAIVTGANTGLGFECARALAETNDWHVVVACRSADKGREAVKRLLAQTRRSENEIEAMTLDLASLESVRNFARDYAAERRPPLRALVCNAATQIVTGRTFTKDGFETTFGVNHLGHFLLVNLMLAQMTPPARIVVVSSGTHDPAQTTGMPPPIYRRARFLARPDEDTKPLDDQQGNGRPARVHHVEAVQRPVHLRTRAQIARRKSWRYEMGLAITVNAFDPGLMPGTGLARDYGRFARFAWRFVLPVLRPFVPNVNSVARSGQVARQHGHRAEIRAHLGKILPGRARRAVVEGLLRSRNGDGIVGVERVDGQADARRDDSAAQIDSLGSIRVPRNTYLVVFSVDYILLGLTLVNY